MIRLISEVVVDRAKIAVSPIFSNPAFVLLLKSLATGVPTICAVPLAKRAAFP